MSATTARRLGCLAALVFSAGFNVWVFLQPEQRFFRDNQARVIEQQAIQARIQAEQAAEQARQREQAQQERVRQLKAQGVQMMNEAAENTTGPASFIAVDPDGNPILVDQHV